MSPQNAKDIYSNLHKKLSKVFRLIDDLEPNQTCGALISHCRILPEDPQDVVQALIHCKAAYTRFKKTGLDSASIDWNLAKSRYPEAAELIVKEGALKTRKSPD